jgi:lysophospholipase L1-like esterase
MADIDRWQRSFVGYGLALLPFAPLLYLQGQVTRWKVGLLPDAAGGREGRVDGPDDPARLLVIGESTVAGLGARTHETALAGQFAMQLSRHLGRGVSWHVIGRNGVTARRTIDELVPQIPDERFDHILLGIGGNDVMKLTSPVRWRRDMTELLQTLRRHSPGAVIFITNCPMIVASPVIPQPIKGILWRLSQMHNANAIEFTRDMDRVLYYRQPGAFETDGFFADGIHPSEQGYRDWAEAMMRYFVETYQW